MTDKEIIEKLATEFMGWKFTDDIQMVGAHHFGGVTRTVWFRRPDGSVGVAGAVTCPDFDPLHDPAACALVLDEIERRGWKWEWSYDWDRAYCKIFKRHGENGRLISGLGGAVDDNRYRVVCLAALETCEVTE